jgi:cyclase
MTRSSEYGAATRPVTDSDPRFPAGWGRLSHDVVTDAKQSQADGGQETARGLETTMHRSVIIARINAGAEAEVARIFAESDRTDLPRVAGVRRRELYVLGDCYVHLLETGTPGDAALAEARQQAEFAAVSERLRPYIAPYLPTWQGPQDALARRFYEWTPR